MPPSTIHTCSRVPNGACKPWIIPSRLPNLPASSKSFQTKNLCLRRRCHSTRMHAAPDDEAAQIAEGVNDASNVESDTGKRRTEAEYLGKLSKEPYAVAVLGLVALSKGVEAIGSATKQIIEDREKAGEANAFSGKSLTDREFWKNVGSSIKFGDSKAALQSLNKNINEWSRSLGDASEWAGDEIKEGLDERLSSLEEWVELQRDSLSQAGDSLKSPKKQPGMKAPGPSAVKVKEELKPKDQGSAFGDILKALQNFGSTKMKDRQRVAEALADKIVEQKKDAQPDSKPSIPITKDLDAATSEPTKDVDVATSEPTTDVDVATSGPTKDLNVATSEPTKDVDVATSGPTKDVDVATTGPMKDSAFPVRPKPLKPITLSKSDAIKEAEEQIALRKAKKKAKAEEAARKAEAKAEAAAKEAKADQEAKEKELAESQAREDLEQETVDAPKTVSSATEISEPPSSQKEELTGTKEDKSVAAMVDKIMADTESAPSAPRPRRNISKPKVPPSSPPSLTSTPPVSENPPEAPSGTKATESFLSSTASTSPQGTDTSRPVLSSSSSEKKGPGTAAFFKTGGTSVSGGALGAGGISVQKQEGSKGILGEELGSGPMKPASYLRPNLQVEATGSGGGFKGPGDDNGSSGNGGSGDSQEENGDSSPKKYIFLWFLLLAAVGGIVYKFYFGKKKEGEESGSSADGQIQYSSTGK